MLKFELVTLDGTKFAQEVHEVILPTPDGYIAVFENHAPLVSIASPGVISVRRKPNEPDDLMQRFAGNGGVIEIADKSVRVLVDEADQDDEINAQEVAKALENAQQMYQNAKDQVELDKAQQLISYQQSRLKVAELRRHRKTRY